MYDSIWNIIDSSYTNVCNITPASLLAINKHNSSLQPSTTTKKIEKKRIATFLCSIILHYI